MIYVQRTPYKEKVGECRLCGQICECISKLCANSYVWKCTNPRCGWIQLDPTDVREENNSLT